MASDIFKQALLRSKVMDDLKASKIGSQEADILFAAEAKNVDLQGTLTARAKSKGGFISPEDALAIEERAENLIELILSNRADEDVLPEDGALTYRTNKRAVIKVTGGALFRDKKGRFISPANLVRLLNATLYMHAMQHTGVGGQLTNRTGRLAHSGIVTKLYTNTEKRSASFFFTYMLYPYQVFDNDPGRFKTGNNYSPKQLFKDAIHSALQELLLPSSYESVRKYIRLEGRGQEN